MVNIHGDIINRIDETEFLGIAIDKHVQCHSHVISTVNKTKSMYIIPELGKLLARELYEQYLLHGIIACVLRTCMIK